MSSKPKVAFYWCSSCGGCEEAVVDLHEDLLKVVDVVDIVFWPVALDFKYKDVEAMKDGEIAVSFINGAVRLSEQEEIAKLLRRKSRMVVAFGSCAHLGGIPGLANFWRKKDIFDRAYKDCPSVCNPAGVQPKETTRVAEGVMELPRFYDTVKTLAQTIDVDYFLPGCAPPKDLILGALQAILEGKLPPKGAVLAPKKTLCEGCRLKDSKPEKTALKEIRRPHEIRIDPNRCFLDQGLVCMGPATRSGCGEKCINANMPCRGCFGPTDEVADQGAKYLSAIASLFDVTDEEGMRKLADSIVDLTGTLYRFSLPASMINRKRG